MDTLHWIFVYFFSVIVLILAKDCEVNLDEIRENVPVFLDQNKIITPTSKLLTFGPNKSFTFTCPGQKNHFSNKKFNNSVKITCESGSFQINSKRIHFKDILCTNKQPQAHVRNTKNKCGGGEGFWTYVSFEHDSESTPLYRTCYNSTRLEAIFTEHELKGSYFQEAWRSGFSGDGTGVKTTTLARPYVKANQIEMAKKIIGKVNAERFWQKDMLAKGHYAPCVDFNYCTTQEASFFYVNVGPQWQKFNTANWKRLENKVRELTKLREEPLKVYTGGHGVLELPDTKGRMRQIYLMDDDRLPVPKYFWKTVICETLTEGITFIGLNNPHAKSRADLDALCPNVCAEAGFNANEFEDDTKGLIICCEVSKARKKIGRMYDIPRVKGLLNAMRTTRRNVVTLAYHSDYFAV